MPQPAIKCQSGKKRSKHTQKAFLQAIVIRSKGFFFNLAQEASPLRQKGFHYINTPSGFEVVFNMFKNLMSEKNKSRLYVHGHDMESLYKHVPRRLLPMEYGGEAGPIQNIIDKWEQKIIAYRDYFLEEDQYGTDEKKRPGRPKNAQTLFGVEGSFRKLEVD